MQVALKRQQAAEDAIALGIRAVRSGDQRQTNNCVGLQEGQIIGLPAFITAEHRFGQFCLLFKLGRLTFNKQALCVDLLCYL